MIVVIIHVKITKLVVNNSLRLTGV